MTTTKTSLSLAVSAALASTLALPVLADETVNPQITDAIEVITVHGDFRDHNLQTTANAVSVLSEDASEMRNAQNLEELIALAPNVNFSSGSQRARYYQIRGIGERSQFQEPINPSVGLVIDDIDFTGMGSIASMFDVAQTEIYRGPQGTRFGANAMAGLIQLKTAAATDSFESKLRLSAGNYNSYGAGLVLSGPASDGVNYRLSAEQYQSDGFIHNTYLQRRDTNNRDELSLHGKLAIVLNDKLTLDLAGYYFDFDNGYDAFSLDNNRNTMSDQPGVDQQRSRAFSSRFTYTGLSAAQLIAIFSHSSTDLAYGYDEDWSYVGMHPDEYSSSDNYSRDRSISTAELRLVSNPGSELFNGTTAWTLGIYAKNDDASLLRQYTYLDSDFSSSFDTETRALYGQLDSQLTEQLSLTSGLRIEQRKADYQNSDLFAAKPKDTMIGGKLVLSYQYDDNRLYYGQISRGYKAGGVNTDGSLPDNLRAFDPEFIVNYELGYKVSLLDNNAYVRAALFYMDRHDMQVKSSQDLLRADGSSEFTIYLGNAASGTNKGLELESGWQADENIEIYGALGLLRTEFNDFVNSEGVNLSGRDQAHAPHYQMNLGVNYTPSEHWLVNVSVDSKDSFYFSDSHDEQSEPVTLVNASVSYSRDNWNVRLWTRNLFNSDYATRGFYFGNDPRDGYTAKAYSQLAEPLVYGVTLDYQF